MIGAGQGIGGLVEAIALEMRRHKPRPFAAFRGDYRRPVRRRAKPGQADLSRIYAMTIQPDRSSNIAKLQRGLRIIARVQASAAP